VPGSVAGVEFGVGRRCDGGGPEGVRGGVILRRRRRRRRGRRRRRRRRRRGRRWWWLDGACRKCSSWRGANASYLGSLRVAVWICTRLPLTRWMTTS
jgi:hypothetical protein